MPRITLTASAHIIAAEKVSFDEALDDTQKVIRADRQVSKSSAKRVVEFY